MTTISILQNACIYLSTYLSFVCVTLSVMYIHAVPAALVKLNALTKFGRVGFVWMGKKIGRRKERVRVGEKNIGVGKEVKGQKAEEKYLSCQ